MKHILLMKCFQQFYESFQIIFTVVLDFDFTFFTLLVQSYFRTKSFFQIVFHTLDISILFTRFCLSLPCLAVFSQLFDLSYRKAFFHCFFCQCDLLFFVSC